MRLTVDIADMKVTNQPGDVLVTYALGSCLGIAIHDPLTSVGGLLHVMLPLSTIDPNKAKNNPYMFVDTGVPKLFLAAYQAGAKKERLIVKVAGGACTGRGERRTISRSGIATCSSCARCCGRAGCCSLPQRWEGPLLVPCHWTFRQEA